MPILRSLYKEYLSCLVVSQSSIPALFHQLLSYLVSLREVYISTCNLVFEVDSLQCLLWININEPAFIMLEFCIYPFISKIIPSTVKSNQDILRLDHLCAIKIIESESKHALEIVRNLPHCYLKYINSLDTSTIDYCEPLQDVDITYIYFI